MADKHPAWVFSVSAREPLYGGALYTLLVCPTVWLDQLYVGNPNSNLHFSENLFEGARAWYYSVAGGTEAIFTLPHKMPNSYVSFGFCTWYFMTNKVPGFRINTSCIKGIKFTYKAKVRTKGYRMRGITKD